MTQQAYNQQLLRQADELAMTLLLEEQLTILELTGEMERYYTHASFFVAEPCYTHILVEQL